MRLNKVVPNGCGTVWLPLWQLSRPRDRLTNPRGSGTLIGERRRGPSPDRKAGAVPLYVIERLMPGMGAMGPEELQGAAAHSNETLEAMRAEGKNITWRHSYGTADKSFCIYEAADEGLVQEHSERSGFPADVISEVGGIIGPETADG